VTEVGSWSPTRTPPLAVEIRALRKELADLSSTLPKVITFADWHACMETAANSALGQ
jgi:hypothetical protein